jgi:predicted CoA-binding protein
MSSPQVFLSSAGHVAFYGLKQSGQGFGHDVLKGLTYHRPDLQVTAVHPAAETVTHLRVVRSAGAMTEPADCAVIVLKPADAHYAIDDAYQAGIEQVWLVMNAASPTNVEHAEALGLQVTKGCPLLFIEGLGFPHNLHRGLAKLFGKV